MWSKLLLLCCNLKYGWTHYNSIIVANSQNVLHLAKHVYQCLYICTNWRMLIELSKERMVNSIYLVSLSWLLLTIKNMCSKLATFKIRILQFHCPICDCLSNHVHGNIFYWPSLHICTQEVPKDRVSLDQSLLPCFSERWPWLR